MLNYRLIAAALSGVLAIGGLFVAGCASADRQAPGELRAAAQVSEIRGEAYLFDVRIHRQGKWNTFRLEVYQSDSVLGLGGRGYLGKGVLKGRLTSDTLEVYFPSTNEYVESSVAELLESGECRVTALPFSILSVFRNLPDSLALDSTITVDSDYQNRNRPIFNISMPGCLWRMSISYDRQGSGWRIREFVFDDGRGTDLDARRREYQGNAKLSAGKFTVAIPPGASRIIP